MVTLITSRKLSPCIVLVFLFAFAGWASGGAPRAEKDGTLGKQRIGNGGFEKGLKGWRTRSHLVVEDATVAHRGLRCIRCDVRRRRRGCDLYRKLRLKKDAMYRMQLWARAGNRSRLTVWLYEGEEKRVIANWRHVPRKWTRFRVNFTVKSDGPVRLRIVAPSSFWAPVGRMWLDDVALFEMKLIEQVELEPAGDFDDFPAMIQNGPGGAWVAWLTFENGHDELLAARLEKADQSAKVVKSFDVVKEPGLSLLDPCLAGARDGSAWLVYTAERDDNWDIWAVRVTDEGPSERVRVTRHTAVDVHPAAAYGNETLWVAWESNRGDGRRRILATAVRQGRAGKPVEISEAGCNSYSPDIVFTGPGQTRIAWHSFRDNNTDLYTRVWTAGRLGPIKRLTSAPAIDRGVRMAVAGKQLWLVWDYANTAGYKLGKALTKRVQVARLRDGRLFEPKGLRKTDLWRWAESPALLVTGRNELWVSARVPRDRNSGWDVYALQFGPKGWSQPSILSRRKGMNRRSDLVDLGDFMAIVYQGDDMPGRWMSVAESSRGSSGIYVALVEKSARHGRGRQELIPYRPPRSVWEPGNLRRERGEERNGWQVEYEGRKYKLLFGDLHEHSDLSVCDRTRDETPDQCFQMMRDVARYDFGALTDHGKCFNAYLWNYLGKVTRTNDDSGRFTTFLGEEWTSTHEKRTRKYPWGYYGHRTMLLADPHYSKWYNAAGEITPPMLWKQLREDGADYVLIPHQLADTGNVPIDWDYHSENAEPVAEIFQMRGSYECDGCPRQLEMSTATGHFMQDAWANGRIVGVVASPDHEGGYGKAAVYTTGRERADILEAIRARRTYGTTAAKILLDVRVAGLFMGQVGKPAGKEPVKVEVRADCPAEIESIDIIRNNDVLFSASPSRKKAEFTWVDRLPVAGPSYYYVRVIQMDGEMAWSSPVWLGRPEWRSMRGDR